MDNLGPLPKIHPRHVPVEKARRELGNWVANWSNRHALSNGEFLMLLTEELQTRIGYCVRAERREK